MFARRTLVAGCAHVSGARNFAKESVAKVRPGRVIAIDGRLNNVITSKHVTQGRGGAHINLEVRDLLTNVKSMHRFSSDDRVDTVHLDSETYTLLYRDGNKLVLMQSESFEQIELDEETIDAGTRRFLTDDMAITVRMHEGQAVSAEVPLKVEVEVVEVLGTLGGTGPATKTVRLDNGVELKCPGFVSAGERIVVKTTDGSYVERC